MLVVAAMPQLLGPDVERAFVGLEHARPIWLWAGRAGFVAALLCNAWVWCSAILLVGGQIDRLRAVACYGVGALVNSATPARIGDAVRIALFSRAFEGGLQPLLVSILVGAAGALYLARFGSRETRRRALAVAGAVVAVVLVGAFSATVLAEARPTRRHRASR